MYFGMKADETGINAMF